jgi:hypothetical protein
VDFLGSFSEAISIFWRFRARQRGLSTIDGAFSGIRQPKFLRRALGLRRDMAKSVTTPK